LRREVRRLRRAWILALGTTACLIILTQIALHIQIASNLADGAVINVAGRQRMLSQRLASEVEASYIAAVNGDQAHIEEWSKLLDESVREISRSHTALRRRDAEEGLGGVNSSRVIQLFDSLEPHFNAMLAGIQRYRAFLRQRDSGALDPGAASVVLDVTNHCNTFLPIMDQIVDCYEVAARERLGLLRQMEIALAVLALLVLAVEAALIFRPISRSLESASEQMDEQVNTLTRQESELRAAVHELGRLRYAIDEHTLYSTTDLSGRIIDVNRGFCQLSGYSHDELIGRDHRIVNSGRHPKAFWKEMWETIRSGRAWRGEVCNRAKDGSLYWVDATNIPLRALDGAIERYVSLRFDITSRKLAEEQNRVLLAAFERSPDPMMVTDLEGRIRSANPAMVRLMERLGCASERDGAAFAFNPRFVDPGLSQRLLSTIREIETFSDRIELSLNRDIPLPILGRGAAPRSGSIWIDIAASPLLDEGGSVESVLLVVRDVTERVREAHAAELRAEGAEARARISRILSADRPLRERLDEAIHVVLEMRELDVQKKGGVFLLEKGDDRLRMFTHVGAFSHEFLQDEAEVPLGACLCGRAAISGELTISDNCYEDDRHEHAWEGMKPHGHYIIPLLNEEGCIGVLFLYTEVNPSQEQDRIDALLGLGEIFSAAIERERHEQSVQRYTAEIQQLQGRFERAVEGTSDGLWDYVPETGEVWYADHLKKLIGLEPQEFDAFAPELDSIVRLLHPEDRERAMSALHDHLYTDAAFDVRHRLRMPDGSYRWFRTRGRSTRDQTTGRVVRMSGSISDIHDRYTMESRLDLATRAASIGLWDWDVPSDATFFNDTFYTMLGYRPGELPMSLDTWRALAHPEDLDGAFADIQRHFRGETDVYLNEHRLRCKDGGWRWIRDIGEIVERTETGDPKRVIGVHIDIDHQVTARLELEKLSEELQAQTLRANEMATQAEVANQSKSEFLANMSHEIRTPMTAILGYTDLMLEDAEYRGSPEMRAGALRTIQRNGEHLLGVINDILDISKIEAGKISVEPTQCSPVQLLADIASLMRVRAVERGIEFRVESVGRAPSLIRTDPLRLRQILLNLVGNAIKFTERGSVRVTIRFVAGDPSSLEFSVIDTGIGMTPEQAGRLFQPFEQADSSTVRRFGGTGLGLAISRRLAQMLGGDISIAATAPGGGTTMRVVVEAGVVGDAVWIDDVAAALVDSDTDEDQGVDQSGSTASGRCDALSGVRILLAEDGKDNQVLITHILRKAGADVETADNGRSAVEKARQAVANNEPFDIVLMDMQMPVMDGYEAAGVLRAEGYERPIVALTAHAMGREMERCLTVGCDGYMTKPISRAKLIAGVCGYVFGDGHAVSASTDAARE
ncbi:MAG TPA: PAS domain-containing protein, partial [Phycisphaerae bacterium]|nr:PAS domain-containing protein [Phycisphaerae bacterium]